MESLTPLQPAESRKTLRSRIGDHGAVDEILLETETGITRKGLTTELVALLAARGHRPGVNTPLTGICDEDTSGAQPLPCYV